MLAQELLPDKQPACGGRRIVRLRREREEQPLPQNARALRTGRERDAIEIFRGRRDAIDARQIGADIAIIRP